MFNLIQLYLLIGLFKKYCHRQNICIVSYLYYPLFFVKFEKNFIECQEINS